MPTKAEIEQQLAEAAEANSEFAEENTRLHDENDALRKELADNSKRLSDIEAMLAKNNPVSLSKTIEPEEMQIGQDHSFEFDRDNNVIQEATTTLDDPRMLEKLATETFMNEPVTVHIQESNDDQSDMAFTIEVNGKKEFFREGEAKTVKRMFVEGLARAKKTTYRNVKKKDDDGENAYAYLPKTGVRYPFSVVEDRNPNGRDWLTAILRQP